MATLQDTIFNLTRENTLLKRRLYGHMTERTRTSELQLTLGSLLDTEEELRKAANAVELDRGTMSRYATPGGNTLGATVAPMVVWVHWSNHVTRTPTRSPVRAHSVIGKLRVPGADSWCEGNSGVDAPLRFDTRSRCSQNRPMSVVKFVGGTSDHIIYHALLALITFAAREACADSSTPKPGEAQVTSAASSTEQGAKLDAGVASPPKPEDTAETAPPEKAMRPDDSDSKTAPSLAANKSPATLPLILPRSTKRHRNWKRQDANIEGTALRALGLRAVVGTVDPGSNGQGTDHPIGATLVERGLGLIDYGLLDARYLDEFQLGGDSKGWTYRADAQLSLGPRWRWSHTTSGVMRVGARAHVARLGGVYSSDVRAPTLAVGVRHASSTWHLDAVAEYAPVLTGYFEPPTTSYSVRGTQAGAAVLSFTWDRLHFDGEYTRYWRETSPRSINEGSAWGCAYLGWGLLCLDGRMQYIPSTESNSRFFALSAGISALIAEYEWLHSD